MSGVNELAMAPGPWRWNAHTRRVDAADGNMICRVWSETPGDGPTIARVPELLTACRECAKWLRREAARQGPAWTTISAAVAIGWAARLEDAAGEAQG